MERGDQERAQAIAATLPPGLAGRAGEDEKTALLLARLHQQAGRPDDAIRLLQQLKRGGGGSAATLLLLGRCLREKGLHELAEEELAAAVSLPLEPAVELEARYEWARALEAVGRREAAADVYRGILKQQLDYGDVEARYRQLSSSPTDLPAPAGSPSAPPGVPPPPGLPRT
jgi:tetratricopeptide (TPR) repeat protein